MKKKAILFAILMMLGALNFSKTAGAVAEKGLSVFVFPFGNRTIQQVIDSLPPVGGTVEIQAGTYVLTQGIHINRSNVTLSGKQGVLIKLENHVNQPVILIGTDKEIPTEEDRIENIQILNIEIDGNKQFQSSETDPNRKWIFNNGIDVRMADNLRMSNVDIHGARSGGFVASWNCGRIFISNSSFHDNYYDGIALYASQDIQVSNFICYGNGSAGLSLDNKLKNVSFNGGIIRDNGDVGIFARDAQDLNFHNLMIRGSKSHGCFISHNTPGTNTGVKRLFFVGCSFLDNGGFGLKLDSTTTDSPYNTVVSCLFSGNSSGCLDVIQGGQLHEAANICQ
jgi:Periplasmic copper-binding protein (NosD)